MAEIGNVENLQPGAIYDERVAELNGDSLWRINRGRPNFRGHARLERIIEINDNQAAIAEHVGVDAGDRNAARAIQDAARIEGQGTFQKIISRVAIEKRADARRLASRIRIANNDEAFVRVRDV